MGRQKQIAHAAPDSPPHTHTLCSHYAHICETCGKGNSRASLFLNFGKMACMSHTRKHPSLRTLRGLLYFSVKELSPRMTSTLMCFRGTYGVRKKKSVLHKRVLLPPGSTLTLLPVFRSVKSCPSVKHRSPSFSSSCVVDLDHMSRRLQPSRRATRRSVRKSFRSVWEHSRTRSVKTPLLGTSLPRLHCIVKRAWFVKYCLNSTSAHDNSCTRCTFEFDQAARSIHRAGEKGDTHSSLHVATLRRTNSV